MSNDSEIWHFILNKLQKSEAVTLLVVAESSGSSPGQSGFKMAVTKDEICGSIGGGVMEVRLVEDSRFGIQDSRLKIEDSRFKVQDSRDGAEDSNFIGQDSRLIEQVHRKNALNSSGMICSGRQTVIAKELAKGDLVTIAKIIERLEEGLETDLEITAGAFEIIQETGFGESSSFRKLSDDSFVYREKIGFRIPLYIIGGGHCALALSELMSGLGFAVRVFDDRPNLNTLSKNAFADSIEVIESYETIGERLYPDENAYVVVMTIGYKFDEIVIRQLAGRSFKYLGVLGSKAKMKTLISGLSKDGIDEEWLRSLRTPIGLPINSRTPREIAVSIAAEIIAVKNNGSAA